MPKRYYPPFDKLSENLIRVMDEVTSTIDRAGIQYVVFAGVAAKLYGSRRELSDDVDLMVKDSNLESLRDVFRQYGAVLRDYESTGIVSHMVSFERDGVGVDIVGNCRILQEFVYIPDDLVFNKKRIINMTDDRQIALASPEDVFVFKALSQRGRDVGKFDIDDAIAIFNSQGLDFGYVDDRAKVCNGYDRVMKFIEHQGVLIQQ